jgi:hypothetical protein
MARPFPLAYRPFTLHHGAGCWGQAQRPNVEADALRGKRQVMLRKPRDLM